MNSDVYQRLNTQQISLIKKKNTENELNVTRKVFWGDCYLLSRRSINIGIQLE